MTRLHLQSRRPRVARTTLALGAMLTATILVGMTWPQMAGASPGALVSANVVIAGYGVWTASAMTIVLLGARVFSIFLMGLGVSFFAVIVAALVGVSSVLAALAITIGILGLMRVRRRELADTRIRARLRRFRRQAAT